MILPAEKFSFWEQEFYDQSFDCIIIGAGIVGLNAGIELKLKKRNLRIAILDSGILPAGASTKNAGFACFGSLSELIADTEKQGLEATLNLVERRYKGLEKLKLRVGPENMDYQNQGGFEVFQNNEELNRYINQIDLYNQQLSSITSTKNTYQIANYKVETFGLNKDVLLIENKLEGQLNPFKMIRHLEWLAQSCGVVILKGVKTEQLNPTLDAWEVICQPSLKLKTKYVLVATNGFTKNLLPSLDVLPARAQVLITKPIKGLKLKGTFHYDEGFYYFRDYHGRILLGGGRNLDIAGETTAEYGVTKPIQDQLEKLLKEVINPHLPYEIEHRWSGTMGMGADKTPLVQMLSPGLFCCVRMSGMGVALGTQVAEEITTLMFETGL